MGLGTHFESSPRFCLSTEEYREATRDFNNKCSNHQPHSNYCYKYVIIVKKISKQLIIER